ncbi:DUF4382 domain-containing protein [Litoribrevibacter euphylliae]|uniref:DUF4382 domain-containing protein n=1 Tax=Litoribrevibacter euphylliae TaxID=1834034 RepID=A0ABV7HJP9_9GAMM
MSAFKRMLPMVLIPMTLISCSGGGSSSGSASTSSGNGTFTLSITDAPVDNADSVVVEFTGVEVKPAEGEAISFTFDSPMSIDLLAQQNGNSAELVSDETLSAGSYNWIRLAVNAEEDGVMDSYIEISGTQFELDIPSGSQTGLKLNSGFTITASGNADYTIDFDLRKSVVLASGDYKLRPSLRLVDNAEVGSISGEVDATLIATACADANTYSGVVYVFSGAGITPDDLDGADPEPLSSATVSFDEDDAVYTYTAAFLEAGDYTLSYTCDEDDGEVDDTLIFNGTSDVTLAAGATGTLDF